MTTYGFKMPTHGIKMPTHGFKTLAQWINLISQAFNAPTHGLKMPSHDFKADAHGFKMAIERFQIGPQAIKLPAQTFKAIPYAIKAVTYGIQAYIPARPACRWRSATPVEAFERVTGRVFSNASDRRQANRVVNLTPTSTNSNPTARILPQA